MNRLSTAKRAGCKAAYHRGGSPTLHCEHERGRTAEIGVRMVFGARPGQVVWEVFRGAAAPVLVGLVAGSSGALAGQISVRRSTVRFSA